MKTFSADIKMTFRLDKCNINGLEKKKLKWQSEEYQTIKLWMKWVAINTDTGPVKSFFWIVKQTNTDIHNKQINEKKAD